MDRINDRYLKENQVAENGLLDRRLFLKRGLQFGVITSLASTVSLVSAKENDSVSKKKSSDLTWMHEPGTPFSTYGQPSKFEDNVLRYPSTNEVVPGNGVSLAPLHLMEGAITPNGLHFERHHNGVPQINPKKHRLLIHGLVAEMQH